VAIWDVRDLTEKGDTRAGRPVYFITKTGLFALVTKQLRTIAGDRKNQVSFKYPLAHSNRYRSRTAVPEVLALVKKLSALAGVLHAPILSCTAPKYLAESAADSGPECWSGCIVDGSVLPSFETLVKHGCFALSQQSGFFGLQPKQSAPSHYQKRRQDHEPEAPGTPAPPWL